MQNVSESYRHTTNGRAMVRTADKVVPSIYKRSSMDSVRQGSQTHLRYQSLPTSNSSMSNFAFSVPPMDTPQGASPYPPMYPREFSLSTNAMIPAATTRDDAALYPRDGALLTNSNGSPPRDEGTVYPRDGLVSANVNALSTRELGSGWPAPDYTFDHPDFEVSSMVFEATRMATVSMIGYFPHRHDDSPYSIDESLSYRPRRLHRCKGRRNEDHSCCHQEALHRTRQIRDHEHRPSRLQAMV